MRRGRKPVLTLSEKLAVGGECACIRQALTDQQTATTKYRTRPYLRDVRKIQSELAAVPLASRGSRVYRDAVRQASSDITEIFSDVETQPIRVRRPYGKRTEILDAAIKWCVTTYSKPISRRRAQDCWDAFSAVMKRLEREPI